MFYNIFRDLDMLKSVYNLLIDNHLFFLFILNLNKPEIICFKICFYLNDSFTFVMIKVIISKQHLLSL